MIPCTVTRDVFIRTSLIL